MKAPAGSVVRISYDTNDEVCAGDAIMTATGRTYVVEQARRQSRGKHRGRWHVRCLVADQPPPDGARVHVLYWYPRTRAFRGVVAPVFGARSDDPEGGSSEGGGR